MCACAAKSPATRARTGPAIAIFALKDERAKIDGVIWKMTFARMRIKPEEGMEVIVTGKLTTYPNRSSYQIIVDTLERPASAR